MAVFSLVTIGGAAQENAEPELRLTLDLVDGSCIIGIPQIKSVPIQTPYAKMDIQLNQIVSIKIEDDHETVTLELQNGDKLKGVLNLKPIELKTVFGEVSVGVQHVTSIHVHTEDLVRPGLVLYYSFDKDEGDKVADKSEKNNNGEVHGAKWVKNGKVGGASIFNGRSSHVKVPSAVVMPNHAPKTICMWFRINKAKMWSRLFMWSKDGDISVLAMGPTGREIGGTLNGNQTKGFSEQKVTPGVWHHATWVSNGSDLTIYLDGLRQKLLPVDKWEVTSPGVFIGTRAGDSRSYFHLDGSIDELMVFDQALSAAAIKRLYDSQK